MSSSLLANSRLTVRFECKRYLRRMIPNPGKPPNLPPSKTMLYRTVDADWMEPHHVEQLLWRRHVYNNAMQAIRKRFREEIAQREQADAGIEEMKRQEEEELSHLIQLNKERNARAMAEREIREEAEMEKLRIETIENIRKTLKQQDEDVQLRTKEVEECIKDSKNFVTPENLRERIEQALDNPIVYDYAIDLNGKKLYLQPPVKYPEGQPIRQKGRLYDRTHSLPLRVAVGSQRS